jgi:hypothetical protein
MIGRKGTSIDPVSKEIARAMVLLAANDAGAIISATLSINGGQYMVWCVLGVAYRAHIATKAGSEIHHGEDDRESVD